MLVQCKHQNENQVAADPDAGKYEQPGPMIMEVMIFRIFYLSSTLRNTIEAVKDKICFRLVYLYNMFKLSWLFFNFCGEKE